MTLSTECHSECHHYLNVMLSVVMLNVVMLSTAYFERKIFKKLTVSAPPLR
jgi:hypothetical protein